jgi:predicted GTPase
MPFGAGIVAARRFGAAHIVDPAPHAVGSIAEVLARYPALEPLVPAMGYGDAQIHDLAATLDATPAEVVLAATPIDLSRVMTLAKPIVRVRYELEETEATPLAPHLEPIVARVTEERRAELVEAGPAS